MMGKRNVYHVVQTGEGDWGIKKEHGERSIKNFDTQKEAIKTATDIAKNQKPSQVKIHGEDGKIREEHTHGKDPYPPKG
jgi:hypothetical protein